MNADLEIAKDFAKKAVADFNPHTSGAVNMAIMYYLAYIADQVTRIEESIVVVHELPPFDIRWHELLSDHDGVTATVYHGQNRVGMVGTILYQRCHQSSLAFTSGLRTWPDRDDLVKFHDVA